MHDTIIAIILASSNHLLITYSPITSVGLVVETEDGFVVGGDDRTVGNEGLDVGDKVESSKIMVGAEVGGDDVEEIA